MGKHRSKKHTPSAEVPYPPRPSLQTSSQSSEEVDIQVSKSLHTTGNSYRVQSQDFFACQNCGEVYQTETTITPFEKIPEEDSSSESDSSGDK